MGTHQFLCNKILLKKLATVRGMLIEQIFEWRGPGPHIFECTRVLQPPHKFENFIVTTSTLAQVGGFAQKLLWSSFVKIYQ